MATSGYSPLVLSLALIVLLSPRPSLAADSSDGASSGDIEHRDHHHQLQLQGPPCDEIYVVGEGDTLHTISDKCGDPFILEENTHVNDHDDVYPGLVLKITPFLVSSSSSSSSESTRSRKLLFFK